VVVVVATAAAAAVVAVEIVVMPLVGLDDVTPPVLDTEDVFGTVAFVLVQTVVLVVDWDTDDNKEGIFAGGLVGVYNFGNTGSGRHDDDDEDEVEDDPQKVVVVDFPNTSVDEVVVVVTRGIR
jgi:hypothetical protein